MKILIFILLFFTATCNQSGKQKENEEIEIEEEVQKIIESDYTILEFESNWHWIFKNAQPTELSQVELNEVDDLIDIAIKKNNEQQNEYLKKHNAEYPKIQWTETGFELNLNKGYHRQYVSVIDSNGEKIVWVNFFCSTFNDNWKKELVMVHDGGNCFFNIKINLTRKTYSDLRINGYA
jgi:hypothetical protein